jgi:tripartite-type tricarboxylate transporter receptor subunit TctC
LQEQLSNQLKQPVIIENKAGAATQLASMDVVRSNPDGYTFLLGTWSSLAVTPSLYKKTVQFNPGKDLMPVVEICRTPFLLVLPKSSPAGNLKELIDLAKQSPGKLNFGSWGAGSSPHLLTELLQARTGIKMTHIPLKGSAPALTELIAGRLDFLIDTVGTSLPHRQAGTLKAIAFTGAKRSSRMPDIPTMAEAGVPDFVYGTWYGLFAPKGTPRPIIERVSRAVIAAVKAEPVRKQLEEVLGAQVELKGPDAFAAMYKADLKTWDENLQKLNIKIN